MRAPPHEAGKSSYDLIDHEALFGALPLEEAALALDLGCGAGPYALALAERMPHGRVVGFDLWPEGIAALRAEAAARGLDRCTGEVADLTDLPGVAEASADLALFGTVLHDLVPRGSADAALSEAGRALHPGAWLAAVEFHPRDTRPGPPRAIRLSPGQLDTLVVPHGFRPAGVTDLGPNCYLALYQRG